MAVCRNKQYFIALILGLCIVSFVSGQIAFVASTIMRSVIPIIVKVEEGAVVTCKYPSYHLTIVSGFLSLGFIAAICTTGLIYLLYHHVKCKGEAATSVGLILVSIGIAAIAALSLLFPMLTMLDLHENNVYHYPSSTSCPSFKACGPPILFGTMFSLVSSAPLGSPQSDPLNLWMTKNPHDSTRKIIFQGLYNFVLIRVVLLEDSFIICWVLDLKSRFIQ